MRTIMGAVRTLLTGAGGQVGLDLARALLEEGDEVTVTDLLERPADAPADLPWQQLDVTDAEALAATLERLRPDRVFHLAAILSARGERDPALTYRVNQSGLYNALEASRRAGVRQFIFTSTIAVYGAGLPELVGDDAPQRPGTMYGVTKAAGELLGAYYAQRYGLDFRAVRWPGLIGASLPGGGTSDYALYLYVDGVRRGAYECFCRPETRIPLMYLPDGVRALTELARAPDERLRRRVYNVAAFSPRADEIAQTVAEAIGGAAFTFRPDPARQAILDSWPRVLDDSCARSDWGWAPRYTLKDMTADLIPKLRALLAAGGGASAQ
jgi:threonine 3-dehydrogenase